MLVLNITTVILFIMYIFMSLNLCSNLCCTILNLINSSAHNKVHLLCSGESRGGARAGACP